MRKNIVILCVGNYLMGDEGLGVHFAKLMKKEVLPDDVKIVDGGSGGFKLMEFMERESIIVLIDATLDDKTPGTIRLIKPRFASDFPKAMSTHEIGLKDLVESLTLLNQLPEMFLFTVSIDSIQPLSVSLSYEVASSLPKLRDQVLDLVHQLKEELHEEISLA
jgi:hydrogenase maturation protease